MTLKAEMDRLADAIARKASEKTTTLQDATDALKSLTAYYAMLRKTGGKRKDDDDEPDKLGDFSTFGRDIARAGLEEPRNGGRAKISGRRRDA